jgi:glycosyltransferase involved in cell wall biosynthesis
LNKLISIVSPIMNEEKGVTSLVEQIIRNIPNEKYSYEVILVDDGSSDDSWNIILEICRLNQNVKAIKLSRNFGQHYAITAGIEYCSGELIIVMDGDLQDNPEFIPQLINEIEKGYEVVFVKRMKRNENLIYLLLQKSFYKLLKLLSGLDLDHRIANYSIITRKVALNFLKFTEQNRFYFTTIKWLGFKESQINAPQSKRLYGSTSYSFRKRVNLAMDILTSFSNRPLYLSIFVGVFFSIAAITSSLYIIYKKYFFGFDILGWASLMTLITFSSGLILIILGVIGLYIGKIFAQTKSRPLFIIDKKENFL